MLMCASSVGKKDCENTTITSKPNVFHTSLDKRKCKANSLLPCQNIIPAYPPSLRPSIDDSFKVAEELGIPSNKISITTASEIEFLISVLQLGLTQIDDTFPTWSGFHGIISKKHLPLMHTGFLPVIPKPVTAYSTVYTAMKNFQNVCLQLDQPSLPLFSDE